MSLNLCPAACQGVSPAATRRLKFSPVLSRNTIPSTEMGDYPALVMLIADGMLCQNRTRFIELPCIEMREVVAHRDSLRKMPAHRSSTCV